MPWYNSGVWEDLTREDALPNIIFDITYAIYERWLALNKFSLEGTYGVVQSGDAEYADYPTGRSYIKGDLTEEAYSVAPTADMWDNTNNNNLKDILDRLLISTNNLLAYPTYSRARDIGNGSTYQAVFANMIEDPPLSFSSVSQMCTYLGVDNPVTTGLATGQISLLSRYTSLKTIFINLTHVHFYMKSLSYWEAFTDQEISGDFLSSASYAHTTEPLQDISDSAWNTFLSAFADAGIPLADWGLYTSMSVISADDPDADSFLFERSTDTCVRLSVAHIPVGVPLVYGTGLYFQANISIGGSLHTYNPVLAYKLGVFNGTTFTISYPYSGTTLLNSMDNEVILKGEGTPVTSVGTGYDVAIAVNIDLTPPYNSPPTCSVYALAYTGGGTLTHNRTVEIYPWYAPSSLLGYNTGDLTSLLDRI